MNWLLWWGDPQNTCQPGVNGSMELWLRRASSGRLARTGVAESAAACHYMANQGAGDLSMRWREHLRSGLMHRKAQQRNDGCSIREQTMLLHRRLGIN